MPLSRLREYPTKDDMEKLLDEVINIKIRGIDMISNTTVKKDMSYNSIDASGAIVKNKKEAFVVEAEQ